MIGVRDIGAAGAWADAYLAAAGGMASVDAVPGGTLRHGPGGSATAVVTSPPLPHSPHTPPPTTGRKVVAPL